MTAAARRMSGGQRVITGWLLDAKQRDHLLKQFPPAYPDVVAHHVTLKSGTDENTPLPKDMSGDIVGIADDRKGVQALVVRIGGTTQRFDGSHYHITWSLDRKRGRKPVESNDVIKARAWKALPSPVPITLKPARF